MDEPDAVADLYARSQGRLVVQVAALVGDVREAEDVVQEAFARALARWGRVGTLDQPEAWVRQVAFNLARSRWRSGRRGVAAMIRLRPPADRPPLDAEHVAVLDALRHLPPDQREAVVLHHLLDRSVDAVALEMGVPVGTVKSWLSRGRHRLAELLVIDDAVEEVADV